MEVVEVIRKDVPVYGEWVGTSDGTVNATIRAQIQGYLIKQNYKEGDFVKKDQVLFEIDPRSYQAAVEEAKAQLAQAEARWQTAKANLARIKPLAEQNAVSKKTWMMPSAPKSRPAPRSGRQRRLLTRRN